MNDAELSPQEASKKVEDIRELMTDEKAAELLGIAKGTLYARLHRHNWKKAELFFIRNLDINNLKIT